MKRIRLNLAIGKKKQWIRCCSGGVLSSSSCERTGPALALIVFVFPLIVSILFDFLKVVEFFFFEFYLREAFRKCCQIYSLKIVS